MSIFVQTYDFTTRKITTIPAAELAPGMVWAHIEGVGNAYIRAEAAMLGGTYRHPPFNHDLREAMRVLKRHLDEIYPLSLKKWEAGFRKDLHIQREIGIWVRIAERYTRCKDALDLSSKRQREDCFYVILSVVNNGREHALETVELKAISREQAEQIIEIFCAPAPEYGD
jgi:hypothetical protein